MTAARTELLSLPDGDEASCDRFLKAANGVYTSSEDFLSACKAKNFTAARLRRMALHLVLGITKEDMIPLPYLRVLAFNKRGTELLKAAKPKLPLNTSLAAIEKSSDAARRIIEIERNASQLRSLGTKAGCTINEYTRQIKPLDE